jgi:hypothetical protein
MMAHAKPHLRFRFRFKPISLPVRGDWFMAVQWWAYFRSPTEPNEYPWYPVVASASSGIRQGWPRN